jgi:S1/P1 Nuclease
MRESRSRALLLGFLCVVTFAGNGFGWGREGHMMVCEIAFGLLDAPHQAEVKRLTATYRQPGGAAIASFTDGCVFPDAARGSAKDGKPGFEHFNQFNDWHFINVPRDTDDINAADCHDDCVLTGIDFHAAALHNATTDQDRAEALFFLGHWVGDVHQPLHVSFADDLGGNSIKPINGGFYTKSGNLHSVWDSGIIMNLIGNDGWRIYADKLRANITPADQATWLAEPPLEWAQESYRLTTTPKAQYCKWTSGSCLALHNTRTLTSSYQTLFGDDVDQRLQQAGARLADQIRKNMVLP